MFVLMTVMSCPCPKIGSVWPPPSSAAPSSDGLLSRSYATFVFSFIFNVLFVYGIFLPYSIPGERQFLAGAGGNTLPLTPISAKKRA
jgi:hypothetical protein